MVSAAKQASESKTPVVVEALTTETTQTQALPQGGFTLVANPLPVRTRQSGQWAPTDTTLKKNRDGTYSPVGTAYGSLTVSGGGSGPMATTTAGPASYTLSWPTKLPTPVVSGSTATYRDVIPHVDLVLTATVTGGFSHVLVVKNAAAGKSPALKRLTFATSVHNATVKGNGGGINISGPGGGPVLHAAAPMMWDSTVASTAPQGTKNVPADAKIAADPSTTTNPGAAARQAHVRTTADNTSLSLEPDAGLLDDPQTVYPVYIDPSFNWHPTNGGTPAFTQVKEGSPCTNTSFYNNAGASGDYGNLGVGVNGWNSCRGVMRAYYQWNLPSSIWGAHIGNASGQPGATVSATKTYSASCGTTATVNLHWSGAMGDWTTWGRQPSFGGSIAQQDFGPSFNPTYCPGNGWVTRGFDVTGAIAKSVSDRATQFTVMLAEDGNEVSRNIMGFSRFSSNPALQIYYNFAPSTPGSNQLRATSGANNLGCATATPYPYLGKTIAANPPLLSADISDRDSDHLQATFKYWVDGGTAYTGTSADNIASGATANFSLPTSFVSGLANGQVVSWQVQVSDGQHSGGWSPVCRFIAQPTAPTAPSITSPDGRNPDNGTVGSLANTPALFTVAATSGGVTKLVQNLDQPPATNNPPAAQVPTLTGGGTFTSAGRWKLNESSGTTAGDSAGSAHATLTSGASWGSSPGRGQVLSLNGSGHAATVNPVLNTQQSFTVAAWVKLNDVNNFYTVVSQGGASMAGFYLQYSKAFNAWAFITPQSDNGTAPQNMARSTSAPTVNAWTHLVGTYNASTNAMTLYVNGQQAGTATATTPWLAKGPLAIGGVKLINGTANNLVNGMVSDVHVFPAAVSADQAAKLAANGELAGSGRWRMIEGTGSTAADSSGSGNQAALTGGATWATAPAPAITLNGTTAYAATATPVLNTQQSYSVSAWVKLNDTNTYYTAVSQGGTTVAGFYLQYSKAHNAWTFVSPSSDATNPAAYYSAKAGSAPALNTWTHLVGTFNAATGAMTLYVNGAASGTATNPSPWATTAPLGIGAVKLANGTANNVFKGSVTDVQVFQSELSLSEIQTMYASATFTVTPKAPGPHTMYAYAANAAGDVSGYQSYSFVSGRNPVTTCTSLAACFNNTAITPDTNHALGSADGSNSYSAADLTNAGWASGGTVTVNGAKHTLPQYGNGQKDNVLAANQKITYNKAIPSIGATSLQFLASSTNAATVSPGAIAGNTTAPFVTAGTAIAGTYCFDSTNPAAFCAPHGTISYTDGSSQTYYLTVPDWIIGPESLAAVSLPKQNQPSGESTSRHPKIFPFSVPLAAGKTIASVTLPDVSTEVGVPALHIFGMTTRNTTTDTTLQAGQTWTGAWAAPTEGLFSYGYTFSNQTFRQVIKPSLPGGRVRIKLDNSLGRTSLNIGHATIATNTGGNSSTATTAPTNLTFGGATNVNIPMGAMVFSDPVDYTVAANQGVLVSFLLTNSVGFLPTHTLTSDTGYGYVSAAGSGDHTTDITFPSNGPGGPSTNIITGLDIVTNNTPTQAVLGDGFIDHAQTGTRPVATVNLADNLTATEPTTPRAYGTVAAGIESNQILRDYPQANGSGPSALSRIDRDILDQPNIHTVVIHQGLEDVLAGTAAAPTPGQPSLTGDGLTALITYLQAYGINIVLVGLTPCDGYAGHGGTPNDPCTAAVDEQRLLTNMWMSGQANPWGMPATFFIDADTAIGVPGTDGRTKLHPATDAGDHVNLTNTGFAALTTAYLNPQNTWSLNEGATDPAATQAGDSANPEMKNPYLATNPAAGQGTATLAGGAAWATDSERGTVLQLDGTGTAETFNAPPLLRTDSSFTVSAWVKLPTLPTQTATVLAEDGDHTSAFTLQFTPTPTGANWTFTLPETDTPTPTVKSASCNNVTANTWTHLVGVYNAATKTATIYCNGTAGGATNNVTTWNATGAITIGRARWNDTNSHHLTGLLSDIQAYNYALTPTQVNALFQNIN